MLVFFFFFNDTATTEIYTLSLHDALPISTTAIRAPHSASVAATVRPMPRVLPVTTATRPSRSTRIRPRAPRSEEHTSELQSRQYLVCRLLLEKKKKNDTIFILSDKFVLWN